MCVFRLTAGHPHFPSMHFSVGSLSFHAGSSSKFSITGVYVILSMSGTSPRLSLSRQGLRAVLLCESGSAVGTTDRHALVRRVFRFWLILEGRRMSCLCLKCCLTLKAAILPRSSAVTLHIAKLGFQNPAKKTLASFVCLPSSACLFPTVN